MLPIVKTKILFQHFKFLLIHYTYTAIHCFHYFILIYIKEAVSDGGDLLFHTVARAVPSAQTSLTSVFGMGTGVSLLL